jgi:hypothetical protein
LLREASQDIEVQGHAIMKMLTSLTPEEREAVLRFVGEAVRLFKIRKSS